MAYKVRCSACGKSMRLPESEAGLAVVCLACGTKFVAPGTDGDTIPSAPPVTYAPQPQPPTPTPTLVSTPSAAAAPAVPVLRTGGTRVRSPLVIAMAVCGMLIAVGVITFVIYEAVGGAPATDELTQKLGHARNLAQSGKLEESRQVYREIDRRATEIGVDDPEVRTLADQARFEQEQVYATWLAERAAQTPTPAPAPSPTTAAVVPAPEPQPPPAPATSPSTQTAPTHPTEVAVVPDPTTTATDPIATQPSDEPPAIDPPPATQPAEPSPTETARTTKRPAWEIPRPRRMIRRPPLRPMPEASTGVTDEQIGQAIQRGVEYLIALFDPKTGTLRGNGNTGDEAYACGLNALCVYALLQSGQAIPDTRLDVRGPFMKSLIDGMKSMRANSGPVTYARGIRATALALYNRKEDRAALRADVQYLLMTHNDGAYSYAGQKLGMGTGVKPPSAGRWDNSNTQYGLLGVWSGAEVDIEIPNDYWAAAQRHWALYQNTDGTWAYTKGPGTLSMTAAGTASLFVAEDYLYGARFGARVGREPFSPPLKRAMDWWEGGGDVNVGVAAWWGYTLYGIERVGLASGFKYFGKSDWYRDLAKQVVARQTPNGSWNDMVDTAYALLFLARGRHPILMNKLRFDRGGETGEIQGFWGNRPRDAANLARYAGRQLERPLNWQVVSLARPWHDWLDSPILSIASHRAPYFTDEDCEKFREYAEAGGMLFLQADGDSAEFNAFARRFAARVFPNYEMRDLPIGHVLYSTLYKVHPPPPLKAVSNGARVLLLYSPRDITRAWQLRDESARADLFKLGVNMFVYAAGKRELRNRLSSPYVSPPPARAPNGSISVVRLRYGGNWDPEPGAWRRFASAFQRQTGTSLAVDTASLNLLSPRASARFAHLTGTSTWKPSDDELHSLRAYVEAGGVVLIDACGATADFTESMKTALADLFPDRTLKPLPRQHPILQRGPPGMEDLTKPRLRPFVIERSATANPKLQFLRAGEGTIVLSEIDVVSGLLGTQTWGIFGYDPAYAQALMTNLIFWTGDGQADE